MYKLDLALNNRQGLISHKIKPKQTSKYDADFDLGTHYVHGV